MAQDLTRQDITIPEENPMVKDIVEEVTSYVEDYREGERIPWRKLFPTRQQRKIEEAKYKTVQARYDHQTRAIRVAHEAQLQAIQEMYNDFLVQGKAKIRKDRSEFFQEQYENLMMTLANKSQEFTCRMNAGYQQLEAITVESLRKRQERLIGTIADSYYETVEKLIRNFQRILDEEIHSPGMPRMSPPSSNDWGESE
jgi:hypothetical protein